MAEEIPIRLEIALDEIKRLRARILELEAEWAIHRGTIAPHPADDAPGNYTHDVAPNAPR